MSKEQIEEMRKDLIEIFDEEYEKRRLITPNFTAEKMTAKGYRKQSEGEWIRHGYKWKCSKCGVLMDIDGTPTENLLHFCPNCGAKMKGKTDGKTDVE